MGFEYNYFISWYIFNANVLISISLRGSYEKSNDFWEKYKDLTGFRFSIF